MSTNKRTSAIVDAILRISILSGTLSVSVIAPNILQVLDKPVFNYLKKLDKRSQEREIEKVLGYMKRQGLVEYVSITESYKHGIKLTKSGRKRAEQVNINALQITKPARWDRKWRLVFYDIPESNKTGRDAFKAKLRELGFVLLQRSIWINPYSCREEIEAIALHHKIARYVSYVELSYIDSEKILKKRFNLN